MSLKTKVDPFSLGVDGLACVSTAENKTMSTAEARGEDGFVVAIESFGEHQAPSAEYAVTAPEVALSGIILGKKDLQHITPASISISTSAGGAPTVTISGQEVEATGGVNGCTVTIPEIKIKGLHHAQDFGLFEVGGNGAHLTQSTLDVSCDISTVEVDGVIKASDLTGGKVTVTGTIQVSHSAYGTPTVTLKQFAGKDGMMTAPLSCTNPNGDFPTWTFTAEWPLAADAPAS